ncbi:hypothetical protein FGHELIBC_00011 [Camelpox virus]|uniref:Uncharacterized protein n=1 Tax=Camelpox virus TaxID=28873 RepID=A0A4Y5N061_9POXV|nr:hypothetical protein FGHELIBC_00011 [Camelpox virus]
MIKTINLCILYTGIHSPFLTMNSLTEKSILHVRKLLYTIHFNDIDHAPTTATSRDYENQYLKIIYFWKENTMILSINLLTVPLATLLITTIKHIIMISSLY